MAATDIPEAEVLDAEGEEVDQIGTPSTTAALVPHQGGSQLDIMRPIATVEAARKAFGEYQQLHDAVVTPSDRQRAGSKEFTTKSGWRKLAVVMGVSCELKSRDYVRDAQGRIMSAETVIRAIAPNGRFQDGLGICDLHERCCPKAFGEENVCKDGRNSHHHCAPGCDGWNHFSKPQHDIAATAATRAQNRACSDLFGFGEVSAEEMTDEPATKADIDAIVHALNGLEGDQRAPAKRSFAERFGLPKDLQVSQVDAAVRFVRSLGVEVAPVPDPAASAAAQASDVPHAEDQATDAAPPGSAVGAPEGDTDSESSGSDGGAEPDKVVGSDRAGVSAPPRASTPQQRQTIGMRFKELEANGIVREGDKAEIVGILTLGRTTTTTQISFEEAVKLVALAHFLEQGTIVYAEHALTANAQPGTSFLDTLPALSEVM